MGRVGSTVFLAKVAEFLRTRFLWNAFLPEGNLAFFIILLTFLLFSGLTSVGPLFLFVSITVFDYFEDVQEALHVLRDDTLGQAKLVLPIRRALFQDDLGKIGLVKGLNPLGVFDSLCAVN